MYDLFLLDSLPRQQATMAPHMLNGDKLWLKRAAKRNSRLAPRLNYWPCGSN